VQAVLHSKSYQLNYPIRQGLIDNWNNMEKLWQRCYYDYLRVEPEEHYVLLVRPCRVSRVPAAAGGVTRRILRCYGSAAAYPRRATGRGLVHLHSASWATCCA